jgi:ABC-type transport system involved in cytochrome c biogenesis ATPase subunit
MNLTSDPSGMMSGLEASLTIDADAPAPPGKPTRISLALTSLCFSGGQKVSLEPDTILVLVGPNNAGKSRALRDIREGLRRKVRGRVVAGVEFNTEGSAAEFQHWAKSNFVRTDNGLYRGIAGLITDSELREWPSRRLPASVVDHLCILASAEERFSIISKDAPTINYLRDPESHPLHFLLTNESSELIVSDLVRRSFGVDVVVNHGAGPKMRLHCGTRPSHTDRVGSEYLVALDGIPTIDEQGDGLKSFFACLVQVLLGSWKLVLLDEPEMFLHPPQAEQLGEILARRIPKGRQLVIATHSADLLRGMLKHAAGRIKLVRVVRSDDVNNISELAPHEVASLWRDPSLRFTSALDSLFHESVVVCESEADCHFYEAVLEVTRPNQVRPMFAPAGGKQGLKKLVASLRALGVPCSAIADFDILNDRNVLRALWEAVGGDWNDIESEWQAVRDGVETNSTVPHCGKVLEELKQLLRGSPSERLSDHQAKRILEIGKISTAWAQAKTSGLSALPQGRAGEAGRLLLEKLATRAIHVVPVGELERFVSTVGGKSGAWVAAVFERYDLVRAPELETARQFVVSVAARSSSESPDAVQSRSISLGNRIKINTAESILDDQDPKPTSPLISKRERRAFLSILWLLLTLLAIYLIRAIVRVSIGS